MILSKNIPLNASIFFSNIQRDVTAGLTSSDYRGLLIRETKTRYPGLVEGLADLGQAKTRKGQVKVVAEADHIIPDSVWKILIPLAWSLPQKAPATPNILSNLFWRAVLFNRGAKAEGGQLDQPWIDIVKKESASQASKPWAQHHIERFLRTKHDEGVNIDVPVSPHRIAAMQSGGDFSEAIEFIEKVRQKQPRISPAQLADLVENRFPHIRIETDGRIPRIEIG